MFKFLVLSTVLFLGGIEALCQSSKNIEVQGPVLYSIYLSEDTSTIKDHWKLDEAEILGIKEMLEIQRDVFGKLEYPTGYQVKQRPFPDKKHTVNTLEFDSVSPFDRTAQVEIDVFKRTKRKSQFLIQEVNITSKSHSLKGLADSLCSPYLEMILANHGDSLAEIVFRTKELKQSLDEFKKNTSKKESENAEAAYGFMSFAFEIVQSGLNSIDTNIEPSFEKCALYLKTGAPKLNFAYHFRGKEGEDILCTMSFGRNGNSYKLSGLTVTTGARRVF